ncbi:MAG: phytanoyl-CoA dioxygenase family protein [Acidimicrobiia bacterium]
MASDGLQLRVDAERLTDLLSDQVTVTGWWTNGTLDMDGRYEDLLDWWLLLRGACDGVAPHVPGDIDLVDADGAARPRAASLLPTTRSTRSATSSSGPARPRIRGLFTEAEMAAVSRDMDRAAPTYTQGDGNSWWATLASGEERVVRMQRFDEQSEAVAKLVADDRFVRLGDLTGDHHEWGTMAGNNIEALFKPIGVVAGISDIPWHKDCALGRHSFDCAFTTMGISVTGADAVSGQLRVVAGSHRALMWPMAHDERRCDLPAVDLPTETGDVTVHLSCTLHMAQAPVTRERRVMYTSFRLPLAGTAAEAEARERLRAIREAAPIEAPLTTAP